jgi:hypothetical protein
VDARVSGNLPARLAEAVRVGRADVVVDRVVVLGRAGVADRGADVRDDLRDAAVQRRPDLGGFPRVDCVDQLSLVPVPSPRT